LWRHENLRAVVRSTMGPLVEVDLAVVDDGTLGAQSAQTADQQRYLSLPALRQ